MKIYNLCYSWKTEGKNNFGNINITTKKRLNERITDVMLDDRVWFAIVRHEQLINGEFRVKETEIIKQVIGDPK